MNPEQLLTVQWPSSGKPFFFSLIDLYFSYFSLSLHLHFFLILFSYGTCGGISLDAKEGCIVVASKGSGYISRNPDAFASLYSGNDSNVSMPAPYNFHKVAPADPSLSAILADELALQFGKESVVEGVNVTADSFYSSQGRIDTRFEDGNTILFGEGGLVVKNYPDAASMEMESFSLLHLAACSKEIPIKAAACAIVVANRITNQVVNDEYFQKIEAEGCLTMLKTIVKVEL